MPKSNAVSLQLEISAKVPRGHELTRELMDAIVRRWAEDGSTPRGMSIKIIDWTRDDGSVDTPADVDATQDEARESFRRLLRAGRFTVRLRGD